MKIFAEAPLRATRREPVLRYGERLVAGGAIGELNEELVWRHLTV